MKAVWFVVTAIAVGQANAAAAAEVRAGGRTPRPTTSNSHKRDATRPCGEPSHDGPSLPPEPAAEKPNPPRHSAVKHDRGFGNRWTFYIGADGEPRL